MNTNPENPNPVPLFHAPFRATSNRDYRGQPLPSIFGPEIKSFGEQPFAKNWLLSIKNGGKIEKWNEHSHNYDLVECVPPEGSEPAALAA